MTIQIEQVSRRQFRGETNTYPITYLISLETHLTNQIDFAELYAFGAGICSGNCPEAQAQCLPGKPAHIQLHHGGPPQHDPGGRGRASGENHQPISGQGAKLEVQRQPRPNFLTCRFPKHKITEELMDSEDYIVVGSSHAYRICSALNSLGESVNCLASSF